MAETVFKYKEQNSILNILLTGLPATYSEIGSYQLLFTKPHISPKKFETTNSESSLRIKFQNRMVGSRRQNKSLEISKEKFIITFKRLICRDPPKIDRMCT